MNLFSQHSKRCMLSLRHEKLFFTVLIWQNLLLFSQSFVNKHPSNSEVICHCRSTYEGCDLVPVVTFSVGDSELIISFQEAHARLFSNCYNKQGIQLNLHSNRSMNQGTICAKVYPEGVQAFKGNNCGLIPYAYRNARLSH